METLLLTPHPAKPPRRVHAVTARVLSIDANWCVLRWKVEGANDLVVPGFAGQGRQDGLWQTTCFELFVAHWPHHGSAHGQRRANSAPNADPGLSATRLFMEALDEQGGPSGPEPGAYSEFNFSPSERWAAYDFAAYRTGMAERAMPRAPVITPRRGGDVLFCDVAVPRSALPPLPWRYGLTSVLDEHGVGPSYWAMAHPPETPDFHDPACHGARLAAAQAT